MSERVPRLLLADILDSVEAILTYTSQMSYDEFLQDRKTKDAVVRNIAVIGEAAKRIPEAIKTKYPQVEWQRIIRSRHIVVHEYAGIDYEIVWRIIEVHLPDLRKAVAEILLNDTLI